MSRSVELTRPQRLVKSVIASAGIPNAAPFLPAVRFWPGHRSSSSRCHPQVYETWFRHLQIPVYLISHKNQDASPSARLTGPKLRRCVRSRRVQPVFPDEKRLDTLVLGKTILRENNIQRRHFGVTVTFARIDAALISGTRLSPFTQPSKASVISGSGYHQSTHIRRNMQSSDGTLHRQHGRM